MSSLDIFSKYRISRPIRRTMIFSLEIFEKNNDECILILVIYWKKTGLLHIIIIYSSIFVTQVTLDMSIIFTICTLHHL